MFTAFKVHEEMTLTKEGASFTMETDRWYAPGVGIVKTIQSMQGQVLAQYELVEFHAAKVR